MITYEGQCNWCDEKEHIGVTGVTGTNIKQINHIINLSNQAISIYNIGQREKYLINYDIKLHMILAELIVKKCANIVWDEAEKTMSSEVNDAGYKIIEYFGVAESEE